MKQSKRLYMHTIDGKPAFFDGRQICFMRQGRYGRPNQVLVTHLDQIKEEQEKCIAWRAKQGFTSGSFEYGYTVVGLPY